MRLGRRLLAAAFRGMVAFVIPSLAMNGGDKQTLNVSGGVAPYTFDIPTNPSFSSVGTASGASVVIVAGLVSGTTIVRVTDSLGHTATCSIVVTGIASPHGMWDLAFNVTQSGTISNIKNQISSHDLAQATGGSQPSYTAADAAYTGSIGAQPVATTAGGKFMATNADALAQPWSTLIIGQWSGGGGNLAFSWGSTGGGPFIQDSGTGVRLFAGTALIDNVAHNVPGACVTIVNGNSSFSSFNDFLTGGVSGAAGAQTKGVFQIFGAGGFNIGSAKMGHAFIKAGVFSAGELTMCSNFAKNRFGITVT